MSIVLGDRKTAKEIAQVYQKVYGQKLDIEIHGTMDEMLQSARKAQKEQPQNITAWLFKLLLYYSWDGSTDLKQLDTARIRDLKPKTLEQFFASTPQDKLHTLTGM